MSNNDNNRWLIQFLYWPNSVKLAKQTRSLFSFLYSSNTQWFRTEELSKRQCHCSPPGRSPADSKQLHPHQVQLMLTEIYKSSCNNIAWTMPNLEFYSYFKYLNRMVTFQVPHSAVPLWETAVALACSTFSWSIHYWRGVLQKDHRKCAHHTTAFRHVQIQRYMSYRETEKRN